MLAMQFTPPSFSFFPLLVCKLRIVWRQWAVVSFFVSSVFLFKTVRLTSWLGERTSDPRVYNMSSNPAFAPATLFEMVSRIICFHILSLFSI